MLKNCLVVDAILFSNLHECEFASESYLANSAFYKSIRKPFPVALSFRSSRRRSQRLALFLDQHRASSGNPSEGFIFRNLSGKPLHLDALVGEVIQLALEAEKIPWYGWHAFRRGLATNLHRLGVSDKVIQQILRHAKCDHHN